MRTWIIADAAPDSIVVSILEQDEKGRYDTIARDVLRDNAGIVCAAPTLLEACKRVRNFLLCSGRSVANSHAAHVLTDAIALAERKS